jgi:Cys-tRNA(Pro)/Cys-tRNA(Cys) deacylase
LNVYEEKLKKYILKNNMEAQQYIFETSCHSVYEAALAAKVSPKDLVKNICMVDSTGNLIVSIVNGKDRVSTSRVSKVLNIEIPRSASPEEILKKTGYPCGGVPSFGYDAIFLIDPKVSEMEFIYTGGGSTHSLTKLSTRLMLKINKGKVVRIRK